MNPDNQNTSGIEAALQSIALALVGNPLQQQPWQAPALTSGWSNYGGGFSPAGYFKDNQGIVHLRGMVKGGTMGGTVFTLPPGYRPSAVLYISAVSSGSVIGIVSIDSAGIVKFDQGSNVYVSLDTCHFRAEA